MFTSVLFKIIGSILMATGLAMCVPMVFALAVDEIAAAKGFLYSAMLTFSVGTLLFFIFRKSKSDELRPKEGFFVVSGTWFLVSLAGGLPFYLSGVFPDHSFTSFVRAFFESASGFSTTGATIFTDVEALPKAILLWRSISHWLGGMGIIVLSLLVLPLLGVSGFQLFRAEAPGIKTDMSRIHPRIKDTAQTLWLVYLFLTFVETILLWLGGMSWFDAINHAFATMATGGFSTKNNSIEYFNSRYIEGIITLFMFIAGANFTLHYYGMRGKLVAYFKDFEFRWYVAISLVAATLIGVSLWHSGTSITDAIFLSFFQVATIITTTGFSSADFELWPRLALLTLLMLMFVGGCAGSTGGGIKVMRVVLFFKLAYSELFRLVHPNAINRVKIGWQPVSEKMAFHVWGFLFWTLAVFSISSMLIFMSGVDFGSSLSSVISCLGNIGPGFASIGPSENYAHFSPFVHLVQIFCMITGRLELFTVLILFAPAFWKN